MTAPPAEAPWVPGHATACAEAVVHALDLLDGDDVEAVPDTAGPGFTLHVLADPPPAVRALHWSPDAGWSVTRDPAGRREPRWSPLPVAADVDPLELSEALTSSR